MTDETKMPEHEPATTAAQPAQDDYVDPIDLKAQLSDASNNPGGEGIVTLLGVPVDALKRLVNDKIATEGALPFLNSVRELGSYDNLLYFAVDSSQAGEFRRVTDFLNNGVDDKFSPLLYTDETKTRVLLGASSVRPNITPGAKRPPAANGSEAILRMLASRAGNIRRIPLYNSGFVIDIRTPTVNEVNELLRQCRIDKGMYESQLGAPFYMFYDRLVKVRYIEFLLKLVVASTLKNWTLEGVLLSSIKLADYNAILAHTAAMMYPKGYPNFRRACTRPHDHAYPNGCSHVDSITADIGKMVHTRFSLLTPDAVTHMCKARLPSSIITPEELVKYQEYLGFDGKVVDFGGYRWTLKSPTLADHLDAAAVFNAELLHEVKADDNLGVITAIRPRQLRQYSQYIASVSVLDDDGETILDTAFEQEAIAYFLDTVYGLPGVEEGLATPLADFINESQLSYVCYPVYSCPSCGHTPDIKSGFYTVDAENAFFTIALLKSTSGL